MVRNRTSSLVERLERLEKKVGIAEANVTSKLPGRIDAFLQDVSQHNDDELDYTDIRNFSKIATSDDVKKLDYWRKRQMNYEEEDVAEKVIAYIKKKLDIAGY